MNTEENIALLERAKTELMERGWGQAEYISATGRV